MNRLSLAPLTISEAGPLELISAAKAGGFDAVTLRLIGAPGIETTAPVAGDKALIAAIRQRLADNGIVAFGAAGIWLTPDAVVSRFDSALAAAAELGAVDFLAVGFDSDWPRLVANFAALCEAAASYGLRVSLEFMPYLPVRTVADAARLLHDADQPNGGIVVDALHLARSNGTPADIAGVDASRISYVQLCDAPRVRPATMERREESLRHRLYPGDGELPLFDLMDVLRPNVTIDLETPCAADAHLPFDERARRAGEAARRFLAAYRARAHRRP
jgi:sugar phosphate isomerase/epimerase